MAQKYAANELIVALYGGMTVIFTSAGDELEGQTF